MPRWRKPSICECGSRMMLEVVYDCVFLRCNRCGATGKASVPSLMSDLRDRAIA
jgi:hypothetical protein